MSDSLSVPAGRSSVGVSRVNSPEVRLRSWLRDLDFVLGRDVPPLVSEEWVFSRSLECWRGILWDVRHVVGWYREGGGLRACAWDPVWAFVSRLMGHRLDRRVVLGCPRVAVLCAWAFFDGRWRECEGVLAGDHLACYLYAGVSGGLPSWLHNRLVLEGVGGVALRSYLRDFG